MNISTYESKINALETSGGGGGGAAYDLVIKVNSTDSVGSITAAEIIGGSFESAYSKALNGDFITVKIFGYKDLGVDGGIYYREFFPVLIYADQGYNDSMLINLEGLSGADYRINVAPKYAANASGGTVNQKIYGGIISKTLIITESGITIETNA